MGKFKITETELKKMISESINKVLKEGTTRSDVADKWFWMVDNLGAEAVVSELYNFLNEDMITDFVETMERYEYLDGYYQEQGYDDEEMDM